MPECSAIGGTSVSIRSPKTQETSQKRAQKDKMENGVGDFAVKSCSEHDVTVTHIEQLWLTKPDLHTIKPIGRILFLGILPLKGLLYSSLFFFLYIFSGHR